MTEVPPFGFPADPADPNDPARDGPPRRRDPARALRRTVEQCAIVFTLPFLVAIGRAALGFENRLLIIERSAAAWAVWSAGIALMVVAALLGLQDLRGKAPAVTGRHTAWWCAGLWVAGLALAFVYAAMVPAPRLR
jgi:hypothetical protein